MVEKKAVKKPFSVRVDEDTAERLRVLSAVLNVDLAQLFEIIVHEMEHKYLDEEQKRAMDILLTARYNYKKR
ncbi:hypothetical protein [Alkaliphilus peptidifermentans]|uniref:Uncharacterized protein n=1 Tax=Alkaliphilus peptidifermentans DSM 18978 TaxID=1120976 RepID=A0A1G5JLC8_9FIRM|nr:hypothetical protein [Alkaliphilus peptidifermentans]SCY88700.1 hypothetical protein SAMN03080606_02885 [Alkaliphilus peptidifermentans DSM 18978]